MFKTILVNAAVLTLAQAVMAAETPDTSTWVKFTSFTYDGKISIVPGDGEYLNPIIAGFYPDPLYLPGRRRLLPG
jgi:hypothetical protein